MRITQKKIRAFASDVETFIMNNSTLRSYFTHFKQKIQICELLYWITYSITENIQLYKLNHKKINISKTTMGMEN